MTRWQGQNQHSNSYNSEFKFKTFKNLMLYLAELVYFLVDENMLDDLAPPTNKTDRNRISRLLHRVPDS
jgi:hypothetical protein